jgi:hypothetical protein
MYIYIYRERERERERGRDSEGGMFNLLARCLDLDPRSRITAEEVPAPLSLSHTHT